MFDLFALGGRPYLINPLATNPTVGVIALKVADDSALETKEGSGYLSIGEPMKAKFSPEGLLLSVRGPFGCTMQPIE